MRNMNIHKCTGLNTDSGSECTPNDSADHTKLSDATDMLRGRHAMQRDFDRLGKWAHKDFMRFNKARCKALLLN